MQSSTIWVSVNELKWLRCESTIRQFYDVDIFCWVLNIFQQTSGLKVKVEQQRGCSTWGVSSVHCQAGERHWPQAELGVGKATRRRRQDSGILGRVQRRHWDCTHHSCNRKNTFSPLDKYICSTSNTQFRCVETVTWNGYILASSNFHSPSRSWAASELQ